MEDTNQFYKSQHGFRAKRSCEQAIMDLLGKILHGLNNKKNNNNINKLIYFLTNNPNKEKGSTGWGLN